MITASKGLLYSTQLIGCEGLETYCDGTGNCATRNVDVSVQPGYDDMTGVGAPTTGLIWALGRQ
jgi:hypothetical protein